MHCDICGGRRVIVLPARPRIPAFRNDGSEQIADAIANREFPCPQCAPSTTEDRVDIATVCVEQTVRHPGLLTEQRFLEAMKREAAHRVADFLLSRGYISIEMQTPSDGMEFPPPKVIVRGTVGVIAPSAVASMEERIAVRQVEVAREATEEAKAQVQNWGSDLNWRSIAKEDACRMIDAGLQEALRRRAPKKEPRHG